MANEVNITITGTNLSGPAFAAALSDFAKLRAEAALLKSDLAGLGEIKIDVNSATASLIALRSKMQALGIADIADINVQPGRISTQLNLLKRLIGQAGISDILDVNIDRPDLNKQLQDIAHISETIPINFKLGNIPTFPTLGPTENLNLGISAASVAATQAEAEAITKIAAAAGGASPPVNNLARNIGYAGGYVGALTRDVQIFGGTVPLWHLAADSVFELAATLIPAAVAFTAFGVAAIPTAQEIYKQMSTVYTVSTAFGQSIYPLTGGFQQLAQAVKPEVLTLFGEGLVLINSKTGEFQTLATGAGRVVDNLGARFVAAVTSGSGFNGFLSAGVHDLQLWGDIIGNLGGIFGNLFRAMPGYAGYILQLIDDATKFGETLTRIAEPVIAFGLALHGAILYGSLAFTALIAPMKLLGTSFSFLTSPLTTTKSLFTNIATLLASGGKWAIGYTAAITALAAEEGIAAAAGLAFEDVMATIAAVNPLVWVAGAVVALGGLLFWLSRTKDATQQWADTLNQTVQNASITGSLHAIAQAQAEVSQRLADTQKYITVYTRFGGSVQELTQNYSELLGEQSTLQGYQDIETKRIEILGQKYGGTANALLFLTQAGVTQKDMLDASGATWQKIQVEVAAAADSFKAMALSQGQLGAAENALNNTFITGTLPSLQKVTQAQDNLINLVIGGEQAFIGFEQGLGTMAKDASAAGAAVGGLNSQSLTLSNDFYATAIPAMQKVITSLEQENTSTGDLTKVIATGAGQLLTYAGKNDAARASIVAMINDALGPNTVSLQTLNKWVGTNSTSLQGFNSIVDKATIQAGTLANVLQTQLTAQFQADLLKSSGATAAMQSFTNAIVNGGTQTNAYHDARQRLITDLENTGLNATQAKNYVNNLQNQINAMHGKTVDVGVHGTGSGGVEITPSTGMPGAPGNAQIFIHPLAKGGLLSGFGGGDQIPALLEPGEAVIDKWKTRQWSWLFKMIGVPGFASGGLAGLSDYTGSISAYDSSAFVGHDVSLYISAVKAAIAKAAASSPGPGASGPGGGAPSANAALARRLFPQWSSGAAWNAWNYVAMAESGWNQFAMNPGSGAYGIPQALPFNKMPRAAWPASAGGSSNPTAQIDWMASYMSSRYGGPIGAAAHEAAFHWYDTGGILQPGLTMAYNGTGRPEAVIPPDGLNVQIVLSLDDSMPPSLGRALLESIRYEVRTKGGGNVQKTFGRS